MKHLPSSLQPVIDVASNLKEKSIEKIFDALKEANVKENIQSAVGDMLIRIWISGNLSAQDVFNHIRLDVRYLPDHSNNVPWMKLWIRYAKDYLRMSDEEMTKLIDIADERVQDSLHEDFAAVMFDRDNARDNVIDP